VFVAAITWQRACLHSSSLATAVSAGFIILAFSRHATIWISRSHKYLENQPLAWLFRQEIHYKSDNLSGRLIVLTRGARGHLPPLPYTLHSMVYKYTGNFWV
jgi:hypothetical protein